MKTILKIQKDSVNTLKELMLKHSNKDLSKLYVMAGCIKETGYDVIEEVLIDLKAKTHIVMGIDKKNTTKKMLENVLSYTKNVYIWDNNEHAELSANLFIFEYEEEAFVLSFSGDITDSLLETDVAPYFVIEFDLIKDKKEYSEIVDLVTKSLKDDAIKLTKEVIKELSENKKIFTTRQYIHSVPSIAELLGNKEKEKETENETIEKVEEKKLPKVSLNDLDDVSFEIDLGDIALDNISNDDNIEIVASKEIDEATTSYDEYEENIEENFEEDNIEDLEEQDYVISDEAIDLEDLIFETETVRLDKKKVEKAIKENKKESKKVEETPVSKKIDLKKVSNIIMELPKKPTKGRETDSIKVPTYVKEMIPAFFETMEEAKLSEREDGKYKEVAIRLEIIDVNSGEKYTDNSAKLSHKLGQTYVTFESDKLIGISYEELDIARVIKLSKDSYHIEIIPSNMEEYNLWKKMCTNTFRGSNRQYGLM